jgi:hypothetical protein
MFRTAIIAATLLCFTACTSMRALPDFSPSQIKEEVEVGERVIVVAKNDVTYDLEITRLGDDALWGRAKTGK